MVAVTGIRDAVWEFGASTNAPVGDIVPSKQSVRPKVGLFVTCLVDLFRPSVGFAAVKLLRQAGCQVEVPESQTCCGQPAYNSGDSKSARAIARQVVEACETYDYVVVPSGSCAGMLRAYDSLLAEDPQMSDRARALAQRTYELTAFLVDVMGMQSVSAHFAGTVTYHDSCAGLRELGVKQQPRGLLAAIPGLELQEMEDCEVCCGFGGTFCVKYPEISDRMVTDKVSRIASSGADTVLAGDLGCLLNIAGKLRRQGSQIHVRHVAEVLAEATDQPAIGET